MLTAHSHRIRDGVRSTAVSSSRYFFIVAEAEIQKVIDSIRDPAPFHTTHRHHGVPYHTKRPHSRSDFLIVSIIFSEGETAVAADDVAHGSLDITEAHKATAFALEVVHSCCESLELLVAGAAVGAVVEILLILCYQHNGTRSTVPGTFPHRPPTTSPSFRCDLRTGELRCWSREYLVRNSRLQK